MVSSNITLCNSNKLNYAKYSKMFETNARDKNIREY